MMEVVENVFALTVRVLTQTAEFYMLRLFEFAATSIFNSCIKPCPLPIPSRSGP